MIVILRKAIIVLAMWFNFLPPSACHWTITVRVPATLLITSSYSHGNHECALLTLLFYLDRAFFMPLWFIGFPFCFLLAFFLSLIPGHLLQLRVCWYISKKRTCIPLPCSLAKAWRISWDEGDLFWLEVVYTYSISFYKVKNTFQNILSRGACMST